MIMTFSFKNNDHNHDNYNNNSNDDDGNGKILSSGPRPPGRRSGKQKLHPKLYRLATTTRCVRPTNIVPTNIA